MNFHTKVLYIHLLSLLLHTYAAFSGTECTIYTYRPGSQQVDQEVATETCREHLRNHVQIGDQGRLEDDGDVGGVEQFNGVGVVLATIAC